MTEPRRWLGAAAFALAATMVTPALAQDADWPCVQRLVPRLEAGQMWSGPSLDATPPGAVRAEVEALAKEFIDLDMPPETMAARVRALAEKTPAEQRDATLAALFRSALDKLNVERATLVQGIKRYARRQREMADAVAVKARELDRLHREQAGDTARISELQAAHDWDARVFADRQRSLRLVCDQPVRLEQRAFALARIIQDQLP